MGGTMVWPVRSPKSKVPKVQKSKVSQSAGPAPVRWVQIEVLSETERRITYEDTGA